MGLILSLIEKSLLAKNKMKYVAAILVISTFLLQKTEAAPVAWSFTAPVILNSGASHQTLNGTFTWDLDTSSASNISLNIIDSGITYPLTISGNSSSAGSSGSFYVVDSNTVGARAVSISGNFNLNLNSSMTISAIMVNSGICAGLRNGLCDGVQGNPSIFNGTGQISGIPLNTIPSLSEWTQLLLALMVLSAIGWHFHRERSY